MFHFFQIRITFKDEEDVINPEDVDPTIGRFRNMIQTTVIPRKRPHPDGAAAAAAAAAAANADSEWASFKQETASLVSPTSKKSFTSPTKTGLYDDVPGLSGGVGFLSATSLSSKLGIPLPNPAPDIDLTATSSSERPSAPDFNPSDMAAAAADEASIDDPNEPKKKKYAKEAWPGRKANPSLI